MIESVLIVLGLFLLFEIAYQVVNLVVRKLNNIPIPGSVEKEEE